MGVLDRHEQREVVEPPDVLFVDVETAKDPGRTQFEAMLTFESVEGGTRVETNIDLFMTGAARLVAGPFARWYGKSWDQGLVNLKRMMEAGEL